MLLIIDISPDPDLLPVIITDEMLVKYSVIPELPDEKKRDM